MAGPEDVRTLSVIVPVYFNAGSLPSLFQELQRIEGELESLQLRMELIFVDDGSQDASLSELLSIKAQRPATKVVKLTRNFGAIHACRTGMRFVTGDCFSFLAADLQDPPELLVEMARRWRSGDKFIICERISREDPWTSKLLSGLYYFVLRKLVLPRYPNGGFDLALLDRAMLEPLLHSAKSAYLPLLAFWLGFTPTVIPYHRRRREHGTSRWTFGKKLRAFLDIMLGFSVTPIRLISAIGAVVSLASIGYGLLVVGSAMLGKVRVPGFPTLVAFITFLLGLIILMLGVIGEYLWRIFEETNRRPETVIDEVY
jgi:dolichol-phosphate mannosyltransferase